MLNFADAVRMSLQKRGFSLFSNFFSVLYEDTA